jgi:hypothetical protein
MKEWFFFICYIRVHVNCIQYQFKRRNTGCCRIFFISGFTECDSWGSWVSIVSDYRLDDGGSISWISKGFSLYPLCPDQLLRPTQPPVHWVSGSFPGVKARPGSDADPHLVSWTKLCTNYISSPPWRSHGCSGTALLSGAQNVLFLRSISASLMLSL